MAMGQEKQYSMSQAFGGFEKEGEELLSIDSVDAPLIPVTAETPPPPVENQNSMSAIFGSFDGSYEEEEEEKIAPPPKVLSFSPEAFSKNIDLISNELTGALKDRYNTDNVKVIANAKKRSLKEQVALASAGKSGGNISLHNFGAGADFSIYIDGKQITGSKKDSSFEEGTEPFQILGGIAKKHGYFWGWKDDSGHVAKTRFVHQFIEQNPDYAFTEDAKGYYNQNKEKASLKAKSLLEKMDEIYGVDNSQRQYYGGELTEDPLLEPLFVGAENRLEETSTEEIALNSEISRIKSGNSNIDEENVSTSLPVFDVAGNIEKIDVDAYAESTGIDEESAELEAHEVDLERKRKELRDKFPLTAQFQYSEALNLPLSTVEKLADDIRTNGAYPYLENSQNPEIAPEALVVAHIRATNLEISNAPAKDSWNEFATIVRDAVGDDSYGIPGTGSNALKEVFANSLLGAAELGVGMYEFVKVGGEAVFMPEKMPEFLEMVGGMMHMMVDEPANLIVATGVHPHPEWNLLSEKGRQRVRDSRLRIWGNPVAPVAIAAGWKHVPRQFHNMKVKMAEKLNQAEGALNYLEWKTKSGDIVSLDPKVKFTPEMVELAENLSKTKPPFREALRNAIVEAKQIELNFQESIAKPGPRKPRTTKTDPNHKLDFDKPIPTNKKAPTKNQIKKAKTLEKSRYDKRREAQLSQEQKSLVENISSIEKQLKSQKSDLTPRQIETLQKALDASRNLITKTQAEMVQRGMNVVEHLEAGIGLTKAQARWVKNRLIKGGKLGVSKFNNFISRGIGEGPYSFSKNNKFWTPEVENLNTRLTWQNNKLNQWAFDSKSTKWDSMMENFFDYNWKARKAIMNSDATNQMKADAIAGLELLRGANSKTWFELEKGVERIEKGLSQTDISKLDGYVQFHREIEIYKRNQQTIIDKSKEIVELQGGKQTAEVKKTIRKLKKEVKNAENYKYSLQYIVDPATGKRVKLEKDGKLAMDDPNMHINNMTKWLEATRHENPKIHERAMEVFELYRKNLDEMMEIGKDKEYSIYTPEFYSTLSMYDYQKKRYINKMSKLRGDYRELGSGVVKFIDNYTHGLKAGSAGPLNNNWKSLYSDALTVKNNMIFEQRANVGLAKFITESPNNGFARLIKKGDKVPQDWGIVEYREKGISKRIALDPHFYESWVKSDPQITSMGANLVSHMTGVKITKAMATGYNPMFAIKNMARDIGYVYFRSNEYSSFLPKFVGEIGMDYMKTAADAFGRKGVYKDYIMEGGGMSWLTLQGQTRVKGIHKLNSRLEATKKVLGYIGETSEIWTRLAVRNRAMRRDGMTGRQATAHARGIMDFNSGGKLSKMMDNAIPYLNASMVASRGMAQSFYQNPGKFLAKSAQVAGVTAYLWYKNAENAKEMRHQINPRERYDYHIVFIPGTEHTDENGRSVMDYLRIPKDSASKLTTAITDYMMESQFGDGEYSAKMLDIIKWSINEMSPLDASKFIPPSLGLYLGFEFNKNSYTGYDLHSVNRAADASLQTNYKEDEYVRDFADEWNGLVNDNWHVSPAKLQNGLDELAISHNFYVDVAAGAYKLSKENKDIKSYKVRNVAPTVEGLRDDIIRPLYRTTSSVNQEAYTQIKDARKFHSTYIASNTHAFNDIIAKAERGIWDADREFMNFVRTIEDTNEQNRLIGKFKYYKKTGEFVTTAENLILKNKNDQPPVKALAILSEVVSTKMDDDEFENFLAQLKAAEFLTKQTALWLHVYRDNKVMDKFYGKTFGEEELETMKKRMERIKAVAKK
jgi:hypothetical protein